MPDFEKVLVDFMPVIGRTARIYENNTALRDELAQEMAAEAWRSIQHFAARSAVTTYLYRVIHNVGANHVRYHSKRNELALNDEPEDVTESREQTSHQYRLLLAAMYQLPIEQRQVMAMKLEGLQNTQIADVSGLTESHVGVLINRAKQRLQSVLAEEKPHGI